jgi:hypothetical protein
MKSLLLLIVLVFGFSSFTTKPTVSHSCQIDIYSMHTHQKVGTVTVTGVPDMVSCSDPNVIAQAIAAFTSN